MENTDKKEKLKELKEYADMAAEILKNTKYQTDKEIIKSFFEKKDDWSKKSIITQLTILDAYYSTNMNKRYFAIEMLADNLYGLGKDKEQVKGRFLDIVSNKVNKEDEVVTLFQKKYGIRKNGKEAGKAMSLISKYAYFLTNYQFPIYDSIVREVYPIITNVFQQGEKIQENDILDFIKKMKNLKEQSEIKDFDKLDNLLWLFGKINKGNYSLVFANPKEYQEILPDNKTLKGVKSEEVEIKIRKYVNERLKDDDFLKEKPKLKSFIKFVYSF